MTDAILIKLAQYQTETRNQKKELKTYSQKLLDREEEMKEIKKEYEEKIKLLNIKNVDLDTTISLCTNMNYNNFKTYMDLCLKKDLYNSIKKIYFI